MCNPELDYPTDIPGHGLDELHDICTGPVEVIIDREPGNALSMTMCRMEYVARKIQDPHGFGRFPVRELSVVSVEVAISD